MPSLGSFICCPKCNEYLDLTRVGPVGVLYEKNGKLGVYHSKTVKCGCCDTTFKTEGATMLENMGRDTEGAYPA